MDRQCDPCMSRSRGPIPATYWCPFCQESFCKVCCQFHQTMKLTRTHKVQLLSDVTSEAVRNQATKKFEDLNPTNFNEKTQLREIDKILVNMDNLSDTALTLKKMNFDLKLKNETQKHECMRKVAIFQQRLKELADVFGRHISGELDYLQQAENLQIDARIDECEGIFNAIEMSKDLAQSMKTEYITSQTIHKVNAARQRCNEFKHSLQRVHSNMQEIRYNLAIDRNVAEALNTTPAIIGKIEISHDEDTGNKSSSHSSYTSGLVRRASIAESRSTISVLPDNHSDNPPKLHDVYLQRKEDQDQTMITAISTLSSTNFLTLDRNNNKLSLVRQDGVCLTQYVFTSQIWDMALVDQMTVAVTAPDNDKIVVVKIRNSNLTSEKLIKTSNICYGICSIDGFLVVTVKGGYVKVITKAGEEVASIRHSHHGDPLFHDPQYVATNKEMNEIYVSDYEQHTVTALCLDGIKFDPRPKFVFCNNELRNPTGLCLDRFGSVYVCGFSSHNVLQLSSDGTLLQVLLTGIINPQTVAIATAQDRIMVSSLYSNNRSKHMQNVIEVFQM